MLCYNLLMEQIAKLSSGIVSDDYTIATHLISQGDNYYHSHGFYECFYIIQGSIEHYLNGKRERLHTGDFLFLPPGCIHSFLREQDNACVHRDVMIPTAQMKRTVSFVHEEKLNAIFSKGAIKCALSVEKVKQTEELLNRFSTIENDDDLKLAYGNIICVHLVRLIVEQTANTYKDLPLWILTLLQKFMLPESYTQPLQDILAPYNYNHSYMARAFKKHVGMTMSEYFVLQKVNYASLLLRSKSSSISEIAELSGFNNLSYFNRCFKAHFSVTPREYRKQLSIPQVK